MDSVTEHCYLNLYFAGFHISYCNWPSETAAISHAFVVHSVEHAWKKYFHL